MHSRHSLLADCRVGVRIAAAEIRDTLRSNLNSKTEKALLVLVAPSLAVLATAVFFAAANVGAATRSGTVAPVVPRVRPVLVPAVVVLACFTSISAIQSLARDSVQPLLLTSVSRRALIIGEVLYAVYGNLLLLTLGAVPVFGYAVGARAPIFLLAVLVAGIPLLVLALTLGLSLGYLFWLVTERLGISDRVRRLVTPVFSIGFFAVVLAIANADGSLPVEQIGTGEPLTPLGWYADLLFLGSPVAEPVGPRTVVAALVVACAIPVAVALLARLAPAYWYATPAAAGSDTAASVSGVEQTPSETVGRGQDRLQSRSRRVALGYARDAVRRPDQFLHFFQYLFPAVAALVSFGVNNPGDLPWMVAAALVVLGPFLGAVFCLNPLGSEGEMLSQLALSETPGETFVNARLAVGTVLSLPLSLVGVALLAAFNPIVTPALALLGATLVPAVVVTSVCVALGIGTTFPAFETGEVFNVETQKPSKIAVYVHAGVTLLVTAGGALVAYVVGSGASSLSTPARLGVLGGFLLVVFLLADGSRRYAAAQFAGYGREVVRVDRQFAVQAALGLAVLSFLFAQSLALFVDAVFQVSPTPVVLVVEYLGFALVAGGFLYVTHRGRAYLDVPRPVLSDVALVFGGTVASLLIAIAGSTLLTLLGLPGIDTTLFDPVTNSGPAGAGSVLVVLVFLMLLVVGPVEELLYRNVVQKYLAEWFHTRTAVLLASAIFTLVHVPVYFLGTGSLTATALLLSVLFVVACLWGAIYARRRSLPVVAAVHGLYNASLITLAYLSLG